MKKITIINAYGDKNIGDAAILKVAIDLILEAYGKESRISVLTESGEIKTIFKKTNPQITTLQLPYGYAIRSHQGKISTALKVVRFVNILFGSLLLTLSNILLRKELPSKGFFNYIRVLQNSDVVIGIGGGYLISKNFSDYFGLLLTLLPVYISKLYKKRIVFLPISFGPFAYKLHEKLCYQALKNTTVIARDQITLQQIKSNDKEGNIDSFYAPDLALFLSNKITGSLKKNKEPYLTLTAREWLPTKSQQKFYEESLSKFVDQMWITFKLRTIFVVMARNAQEDDDNEIANRIQEDVTHKEAYKIIDPHTIEVAQSLFSSAKLAVCTRMHSAILSTTTHTPFLAIGYGHKTLGFVKSFKLAKWHIDISEVNVSKLVDLSSKLLKTTENKDFIKLLIVKQEMNAIFKEKIIKTLRLSIN